MKNSDSTTSITPKDMTTHPKTQTAEVATLALQALETLIDEIARRAVDRYSPQTQEPLWVTAKEASEILGAGYPAQRVKELGHQGLLNMDRRDPENPNSPYIFERKSLFDYSSRRVFEIDQRGYDHR